ncbi:cell division protein PerM [Paraoerskovia marina]|uniref:cell division protein PerM n=1 Tax=Paraoerskovia marina TaxID=545619 RepID=UPI0012F70E05|nr:DUF6350 family protein [Paraoerskovia marina]
MSQARSTGRAGTRTVSGDATAAGSPTVRYAVSGVVASLQALVLSLTVVVLPAVVAYMAAGETAVGSTSTAFTVGVAAWLLGHGMPIGTAGATLTLVPLGVTALALFCCYVSARRSAHTSVTAWVLATLTYTAGTFAIALLARTSAGWGVFVVLAGGLLVGGVGAGLGILARPDAPGVRGLVRPWLGRLPRGVQPGLTGGVVATGMLLGLSGILVVGWAVAGRADSSDIIAGLAPGTVGGIILAFSQLAVVPNLVLYASAWLAGPGFSIGSATFAPGSEQLGPLPAVPLLGGLPGSFAASPVAAWAPLLVVACGVPAGLAVWRRLFDGTVPSITTMVVAVASTAVTGGLIVGVLVLLASGAVGPGSMAEVGADGLLVAGFVAAEILIGAALTVAARAWWERRTDMES